VGRGGAAAIVGLAAAVALIVTAWIGGRFDEAVLGPARDDRADDAPSRGDRVGEPAPAGASASRDGTLAGRQPAPSDDVGAALIAVGRIALGGPWHVRVVDRSDGHPIADAWVEAAVVVATDGRAGAGSSFSAMRDTRTGPDGVATLRRMPAGREVVVSATAPGYLRGQVRVPPGGPGEQHVEVALEARLAPALAGSPLDVVVDGGRGDPADVRVVATYEGEAALELRPGDLLMVDDRPSGLASRVAEVRVVVPGYASPPQWVTITRGRRTRLDAALPPPANLTVVALDPSGAGVPGVEVAAAPAGVAGAVEAAATWRGTTDARGEVLVAARLAPAVAIRLRSDAYHFPLSDDVVDVRGPGQRVTAYGAPRAPLTFVIVGRPPPRLALAWSDAAFHPAVLACLAAQSPTTPPSVAHAALVRTLPRAIDVPAGDGRPPRIVVRVLPGAFTLTAAADGATSAATSFAVPPEGAEVELRVEALSPTSFRLVGDGPASPSPFAGGVWIGHAAGVEERSAVARALHPVWRSPLGPVRDALLAALVNAGRGVRDGLPADVAVVAADGRVDGRTDGVAAAGTLMLPDGRVARVEPAPRAGEDGVAIRVPPSAFVTLRLRLRDAAGRPRGGVRVFVEPLARLVAGRRELLGAATTDAAGEVVVGVLEGDELGVQADGGPWLPTTTVGAVAGVRRADTGDRVVAVRVEGGPVVTVDLEATGR